MKAKIFLIIILLFPFVVSANELSEEFQTELFVAEIIEVVELIKYEKNDVLVLEIEVLSGEYKGETTTINKTLINDETSKLEVGDKINVVVTESNDETAFYFHSYEKSSGVLWLLITFAFFVILIGRIKGLKALISLSLTILLILFGFIPLLLQGYSPIWLSIVTCILATILTFLIMTGFTKKTLIAILGVAGGLIVAGIITLVFSELMHLTGIASESEQMLYYIPGEINFDFKGLLFAGIIIGALGACMDVAMEITSSLTEIKAHTPNISDNKLISSGFNIGKDIMGTMVNTLILAYTGSSLSTILLFVGFEKEISEIINLESISTEIVRSMAGSMGLLFAIPITIYIFVLFNRKGGIRWLKK